MSIVPRDPSRVKSDSARPSTNGHTDPSLPPEPIGDPAGRMPPFNPKLELYVLGSVLLDNGVLPEIRTLMSEGDLFRTEHRLIFRAMCGMYDRGIPINPETVGEELIRLGRFDSVGGEVLLYAATDGLNHGLDGPYYAKVVHEKAVKRQLIEHATSVLNDCYCDQFPASELIGRFSGHIDELKGLADGTLSLGRFTGLTDENLGIVPLASIPPRPIVWRWKYFLEAGAMALMAGDPGVGKSQFLLAVGAAVSTGGKLPDGSELGTVGNVVIVAAEDRPAEAIRPRLMALGADIDRVTIVKAKYTIPSRDPIKKPMVGFASFQDLDYWEAVLNRIGQVSLLIVDPLPSFLGRGVSDSKNIEVRQIIDRFVQEVIEPREICMYANTHLNKCVGSTPLYRVTGSIAYVASARNVHFVLRDDEDPTGLRRLFKQAKCNNAPDNLPALAFTGEKKFVEAEDGTLIETVFPKFEPEPVPLNLAAAFQGKGAKRPGPDNKRNREVAEWLFDFVSARGGSALCGAIFDAAGELGFVGKLEGRKWSNGKAVYRAKDVVPHLDTPRAGYRIQEEGERPRKMWKLVPTTQGDLEGFEDTPF